ncbi:MAG: nitrate- and nitrite sensing domain-containing protein [Hydrogenophaga sp.]|uniref:nitrate- and nitrite sensing domain-containing protein n=1 Tax=Hydrogenophaga sp. TaxID=1904254 RepID=UPI002764D6AA|nr:nitrate- and nitrite sensing domain-containing protein [Hydrogenophaga sp.]MDP2418690.1 nitrate- and nitrite sensing domain-containing protein [Hydrogenophaga sp.]MDZ4188031.1 nitrate- and nitrite sensing domain-containing protein [Hydrogenophaga sp.]
MKSGLNFLVAAKRCEIAALQALALTSALVNVTGRLVHGLQRERGLSNLYLGSHGARFAPERQAQIGECQSAESDLRACFDSLDTESAAVGNGARLFSRIAYVLHGLDALPGLRAQVAQHNWTARKTTDAYVRLIAGLLAVVFEAADSATDPEISRLLVARFNFMQGKEFAGQERAAGSALYACGRADANEQQRLLHLIESQERCLQVFTEFSSATLGALWAQSQPSNTLAELERMRRVLCTAAHGATLDASQSPVWFACCSLRIDRMKVVEDQLAGELLRVCECKIAAAQHDLQAFSALNPSARQEADTLSFFKEPHALIDPKGLTSNAGAPPLTPTLQGYGLHLERSILELVQEQARRLQSMADELDTVRASLNERKLVERAKGLLMAHRQLSEEEAHKTMRQMAMNQNRRLVEVAEAVLAMADVLPDRRR